MDKTHGVGCLNPRNGQTDGWSSSLYTRDEEEEAEGNSRDKFTRLCYAAIPGVPRGESRALLVKINPKRG